MAADGNCLFRAVADQLAGSAEEHNEFRERCCKHMLENAEEFSLFYASDDFEADLSFEAYVEKMRSPGNWGSQLELMAICREFAVNVIVHQLGLPSYEMVFSPDDSKCLQLSYHDGEHYNSVRFAWDMTEAPVTHLSLRQMKGQSEEKMKSLLEELRHSLPPEHGFSEEALRSALLKCREDVNAAVEQLLAEFAQADAPGIEPDPAEPTTEKEPQEPKVTKGTKDPEKGRPKSRAEKRSERKAKAEAAKKPAKPPGEEPFSQEAMKQFSKQLLTV
ncbi:unnamed protein product [Effrenium voratum]|nr:unnamed protein product [Effrenium voratum]CAJ1439449.1 unnamed protein product [Effrenium voratum]